MICESDKAKIEEAKRVEREKCEMETLIIDLSTLRTISTDQWIALIKTLRPAVRTPFIRTRERQGIFKSATGWKACNRLVKGRKVATVSASFGGRSRRYDLFAEDATEVWLTPNEYLKRVDAEQQREWSKVSDVIE